MSDDESSRAPRRSLSLARSRIALTFWVWYLLMPGTPLAFCSVHSMVMFTRTCLPFFAMHVTLRRAAATLGVGLATATREPAKDVDAIILLSRRISNARKHTQRR